MTLASLLLFVFLLSALGNLPLLALGNDRRNFMATSSIISLICLIIYITVFSLRDVGFGTDTRTYIEIFETYCHNELGVATVSYALSLKSLNLAMLGACDSSLLRFAWVILILIPLLFLPLSITEKIIYLMLFLYSLPGVELTTNAMRQGISVTWTVLAVANRDRRRALSGLFWVVAILFHPSALLVFAIWFAARLRTYRFLVAYGVISSLIVEAINLYPEYALTNPLLYEIYKYSQHEGDELGIRVLAGGMLLMTLCTPIFIIGRKGFVGKLGVDANKVFNLCYAVIPFVFLPYFGFRVVYAIYPIVLFYIIKNIATYRDGRRELIYLSVFFINIGLLFAWAVASKIMSETLLISVI